MLGFPLSLNESSVKASFSCEEVQMVALTLLFRLLSLKFLDLYGDIQNVCHPHTQLF